MAAGSTPTFGMTPGNNAPPPMFGSNTNPTGMFGFGGSGGTGFPSFGMYGSTSNSTPMANSPVFNTGPSSGLSTLFNNPLADYYNNTGFWNSVGKSYGVGTGQALQTLFGQLFDPQTVSAYLNSMQPGIARGQQNLLGSFGAEGSRFGSAAALGLGDYNSQVQLNEGSLIAQMYQNATGTEANLIENMMPQLAKERSNSGGILDDILGGLEIAGGIAAIPFSGGMSAGLIAGGLGTLGTGLSGGGNTNTGTAGFNPTMLGSMLGNTNMFNPNTGTFGPNAPSYNSNTSNASLDQWVNDWMTQETQQSAATALGGAPSSGTLPSFLYGLP